MAAHCRCSILSVILWRSAGVASVYTCRGVGGLEVQVSFQEYGHLRLASVQVAWGWRMVMEKSMSSLRHPVVGVGLPRRIVQVEAYWTRSGRRRARVTGRNDLALATKRWSSKSITDACSPRMVPLSARCSTPTPLTSIRWKERLRAFRVAPSGWGQPAEGVIQRRCGQGRVQPG